MSARRVLVVDDEEDVRFLVSRILKDVGYEVDEAEDGGEALEKIRTARPDLVVLDLMMPRLDGWGVLEQLKDKPDPPPVVVLTARGDYESFRRGVHQGAAAYVFKPFRFHELIATCQTVLTARERRAGPVVRERRRDPRRAVMAEVRVLSREKTPIALGELVDIGAGGAQVHLGVRLDPGSEVRMGVHVPDGPALMLEGRVQWCEAVTRGFAHGLSFVDLGDDQRRQLEGLLGPRPGGR